MEPWSEYSRFVIAMLAILTPFAAIPIFLSLTEGRSAQDQARTARTAVLTVFCVLSLSALTGDVVLGLMGTSLSSFRVGGGIVLLLISLSMLNAQVSAVKQTREEATEAVHKEAVGVVPLGIPLLAGPGSISTAIIEMQRGQGWGHAAMILVCIAIVCALLWASLSMAAPIGKRLGVTGLNIMNRLFGLLLAAIAVEIIANGLKGLFPAVLG